MLRLTILQDRGIELRDGGSRYVGTEIENNVKPGLPIKQIG